jgi:hypothetical protein
MSYIGNMPSSVAFLTDYFSGNNSTTAFTMSVAPNTTSAVLVSISGVLQDPTAYSVSGTTLTFSSAPPSGSSNIVARYLGVPASGVTTTAYRTVTEYTATSGQTTFSPPSYTVGYINVYRNGVRLGAADYTASNGTTVVLATGAYTGDLIALESFYVSSVLNALPSTGGTINAVAGATPLIVQSNGTTVLSVGTTTVSVGTTSVGGTMTTSTTSGNWGALIYDTANNASMLQFRNNAGAAAGNISLSSAGATTMSLSSVAGISFPASQNASSDANTLDDYEEGTFTPTLTGSSSNPSYTASTASGKYTKIGRIVHFNFLIIITAVASQGTGNIQISGFPFASTGNSYEHVVQIGYNDIWDTAFLSGYISNTTMNINPTGVTQSNAGYGGPGAGQSPLSTGYFSVSGTYVTT